MGVSIRDSNCHLLHVTSYGRANIDGVFKSIEISPRTEVIFCYNSMEEGAELTGDWDRLDNRSNSYILLTFDQVISKIKLNRIGSILVTTLDGIDCINDINCNMAIDCVDGVRPIHAKEYYHYKHLPCNLVNGRQIEHYGNIKNIDLNDDIQRLIEPELQNTMECLIIADEKTFGYRVIIVFLLIILVIMIIFITNHCYYCNFNTK